MFCLLQARQPQRGVCWPALWSEVYLHPTRGIMTGLIFFLLCSSRIPCGAIVDADGNGMSDVWETVYAAAGIAPEADADGDGQSNFQESVAGTDPFDRQSVFRTTVRTLPPSARLIHWPSVAGIRYQVEATTEAVDNTWHPQGEPVHGTGEVILAALPLTDPPQVAFRIRVLTDNPAINLSRPHLDTLDTDGDGAADLDEYAAGTNPFDAGSLIAITDMETGPAVLLTWPSVAGKRYQVQSSAHVETGWHDEGGMLAGTGDPITVAIKAAEDCRFFQVGVTDGDDDLDGVTDWEERMTGLNFGPLHFRTNAPTPVAAVTAMLTATNVINAGVGAAVADVTIHSPGGFRLTRTGNINPVVVSYTVGGDAVPGVDYVPLPGQITIPAGSDSVEIPVVPLYTATLALSRSVLITLEPTAAYVLGTNTSAEIRVLKEVALSVRDFGAVGDGETDDTVAIQAAINALEVSSVHNTLHFPTGIYRLNTPKRASNPSRTWYELLRLGNTDLAGRDLIITANPGAELCSTVSTQRTRMFMVEASFRSFHVRGLTWTKSPEPLPATSGEPNGAEGVWVANRDLRQVEAVEFADCRFENCHGAITVDGSGFDLRGKLTRFSVRRCWITNPYGSNTIGAQNSYGGGQQVRINPWVHYAEYADCYFDGGSDNPDLALNPGGIRKDGAHFGSPLHLLFTNNVVRRMGVEAVHQIDDPLMGYTLTPLVIPPPDGHSPAPVTVRPQVPSPYRPGQSVNFRTWFHLGALATNVFLNVVAYEPDTRTITVTNPGLTPGVEGQTVPSGTPIYLQDYNPTFATIAGNIIDGGTPRGDIGIASNSKATITGNFIMGYVTGVYLYENVRNVLSPPTPGTQVAGNVIFTRDSMTSPLPLAYGIQSHGPGDILADNLIVTPNAYRFVGVAVRGTNSWVEGNTVLAKTARPQSYSSPVRSVGIGFSSASKDNTAAANRTTKMDVGIGPEVPHATPPHRVISHFSTNDVLAIDPRGLTDDSAR